MPAAAGDAGRQAGKGPGPAENAVRCRQAEATAQALPAGYLKLAVEYQIGKGGNNTDLYSRYFRLAFDFMARWQPCPENPEAWIAAAQDIGETSEKGGNHPFLMDILTAVYTELERQYKAINGKEGQQQCG